MIHGIDTDFLVAVEILDHPFHGGASRLLKELLDDGHQFALAPQILAEFIHVVTDGKRMPQPLAMESAIVRAEHWWLAAEVQRVFPDSPSTTGFLNSLSQYKLGRKRLLDTMLANTYRSHGIRRLISNNESDYRIFGYFEILTFRS